MTPTDPGARNTGYDTHNPCRLTCPCRDGPFISSRAKQQRACAVDFSGSRQHWSGRERSGHLRHRNSRIGNFLGKLAAPVSAAYQGTFTGTGNYPSGANSGSSAFSFSGWAGGIPSGIFVGLGDLDLSENLTLTAFDSSNNQITTPRLNDAVFLSANVASELVAANMPGYKFSAGVYSFYGSFVPGNPSVLVSLPTSQALGSIQVTKDASFGVTLSAPTTAAPEPGSMALLGLGLAGFGLLKFRRK